ncbi:hypothetical protein K6Q96_08905 [Grimontia kaedaensis]|uniref:Uncharacterized protein n=1 Tax=Grimontia kaedaensis TaxID=2872157 RepID=A0ABY4WNA3_9GAMM|nr:hypothetical protein [Grimontia kaedaensis]USH01059.1 hypothetical protein K6Q96_08905 [Grimontia kaedaensis]
MKITAWLGAMTLACLSLVAVAAEKDVYREYVDDTVARFTPIIVDFYVEKTLKPHQKKYWPVVDHFVKNLLFTEDFKKVSADIYRKYLTKKEVTYLASVVLSKDCSSLFTAEIMSKLSEKKPFISNDFEPTEACLEKIKKYHHIFDKRTKWSKESNELFRTSTKKALPEFVERLKQQKLIFDTAEKLNKTLPRTLEEGFDWVDIIGMYQVLEYRYLVNDIFDDGEVYELDTESLRQVVCEQFQEAFKDYISVRHIAFDLHYRRVGESTVSLSECP